MNLFFLSLILIALASAAWLAWGALRQMLARRQAARAFRMFAHFRAEGEQQFFRAAASGGKPRGLIWKECDFRDDFLLARDRASGELLALVEVTIRFEAIEGGDMEEVEAVGNLRCASALFQWRGNHWTTDGKALFNLQPDEVIHHFHDSLEAVLPSSDLV